MVSVTENGGGHRGGAGVEVVPVTQTTYVTEVIPIAQTVLVTQTNYVTETVRVEESVPVTQTAVVTEVVRVEEVVPVTQTTYVTEVIPIAQTVLVTQTNYVTETVRVEEARPRHPDDRRHANEPGDRDRAPHPNPVVHGDDSADRPGDKYRGRHSDGHRGGGAHGYPHARTCRNGNCNCNCSAYPCRCPGYHRDGMVSVALSTPVTATVTGSHMPYVAIWQSLTPPYYDQTPLPISGLAMYYANNVMDGVIRYRQRTGAVDECQDCVGQVALLTRAI